MPGTAVNPFVSAVSRPGESLFCALSTCPHRFQASSDCILGEPVKAPASFHRPQPSRTLLVASLEIAGALADREATTFLAQGTCMYPAVRPGDVLHVRTRTLTETTVGDIAVCRGPGYLFGHRVIRKETYCGRACIVTRPDRTRQGDDGPIFDEGLLGVVVGLERNSRRLPVPRPPCPEALSARPATRLYLLEQAFAMRAELPGVLAFAQQAVAYRWLSRRLLTLTRTVPSFEVRVPFLVHRVHDVYQVVPPEDFDPSNGIFQGRPLFFWSLSLLFRGNKRPAAEAEFVLRPPGCRYAGWWVHALRVRIRYGGVGLETDLLGKAEAILARSGARLQGAEDA